VWGSPVLAPLPRLHTGDPARGPPWASPPRPQRDPSPGAPGGGRVLSFCPSVSALRSPSRSGGRAGLGWGGSVYGGVVSLPQSGGDRSGARKAEAPAQRGRVPHMDRIKVPSGDPASAPPPPPAAGAPESPGALFPAWVRRGEGGSQCLVGPGEVWDWVPPKVHAAAPFRPHLRTQGRGWTVPDSAPNHGENVPSRATPSPLGLNNQLSFFSHLSSARISSVPVLVSSQPFFRTDPCCHYMNKTWPREDE
jgi:hypothetical protein